MLDAVRTIVNESHVHLLVVKHSAQQVGRGSKKPVHHDALNTLRRIQASLARLPAGIGGEMNWLALVSVQNDEGCRVSLRKIMDAVPIDFSVYHYDSSSREDENAVAYMREPWYGAVVHENAVAYMREPWYEREPRIVHRGFKRATGCTVEAVLDTLTWMLSGIASQSYTHLWKLDSDLDFSLFSFEAFRALVAHRAAFLSQPAILAPKKGGRASDRFSLNAQFTKSANSTGGTLEVSGRERLISGKWLRFRVLPRPVDDMEITCLLMDARMLPALRAAMLPLNPRSEWLWGAVINRIAIYFANASGHAHGRRPAGVVFDYVPLVHMDSRLSGWKGKTLKRVVNGSVTKLDSEPCMRAMLPPGPGSWQNVADRAIQYQRPWAWWSTNQTYPTP